MGYQHGEQAGALVKHYAHLIARHTGTSLESLCTRAVAYLPLMEELSPEFVKEVRGLADGAGISFEEALLCQARGTAARAPLDGCTALALTGSATADGATLGAQNIDQEPEYADIMILLRVQPDDGRPEALMLTPAGQLGYQGMNEWGLAHFSNALFDSDWRMGLPHYPLKRVLLEQQTVGQAIDLMASHRTCSAGNVLLCDGRGHIGDVEYRPEGIAVYDGESPEALLHTNHYLSNEFSAHETHSVLDSRDRLNRLRQLIRDNWGQITVDTVKQLLADHQGDPCAICRHGGTPGERFGGFHTVAGLIAEPNKRRLHVRRGHGCLGFWRSYDL
jgi:isopenicillin-N N-acyltransferase-like protein